MTSPGAGPPGFRSGFCALVGRPNVGKSTLMNALVGQKVAITSPTPQTTRRAVRGVRTTAAGQLVMVDTPGLHRPRTLLGQRLGDVVRDTLAEVDVVGLCLAADQRVGPGDRRLAAAVAQTGAAVVAVITKTDLVGPARVAEALAGAATLGPFAQYVPVSAERGDQLELLERLLIAELPEGPPLYPADAVTDDTLDTRMAEAVREAALAFAREELPHSIAVTIAETVADQTAAGAPLLRVFATIHLERPSQKPIVLGPQGARLREIGTAARRDIEAMVGGRVHLDLRVSVLPNWQRDPKKLDRLGF